MSQLAKINRVCFIFISQSGCRGLLNFHLTFGHDGGFWSIERKSRLKLLNVFAAFDCLVHFRLSSVDFLLKMSYSRLKSSITALIDSTSETAPIESIKRRCAKSAVKRRF